MNSLNDLVAVYDWAWLIDWDRIWVLAVAAGADAPKCQLWT
jgi:hypothetical protein